MTDHAKIADTLEILRNLHVGSPRDAEFASHLDRLLKRDTSGNLLPEVLRFTSTGETRGILVIDGPGGGKSTLVKRGLSRHTVFSQKPVGHSLFLDTVVPSPATLKSVTQELLTRSGYPVRSGRSEVWSQLQVFRERLHLLGIAVLWIDEAHDLFCADRNLILRAVKTLMQGEHPVIVILSGTERLREIIRTDAQVQRRFSTINLKPVAVHTDKEQFAALIEQYCVRAELEPPSAGRSGRQTVPCLPLQVRSLYRDHQRGNRAGAEPRRRGSGYLAFFGSLGVRRGMPARPECV